MGWPSLTCSNHILQFLATPHSTSLLSIQKPESRKIQASLQQPLLYIKSSSLELHLPVVLPFPPYQIASFAYLRSFLKLNFYKNYLAFLKTGINMKILPQAVTCFGLCQKLSRKNFLAMIDAVDLLGEGLSFGLYIPKIPFECQNTSYPRSGRRSFL